MVEAQIANLSRELYKNQSSLNPELFGDEDDDLFRPALADDVKVGYFNLDHACQTGVTDIIPLKEMTDVLQVLKKDTVTIKRDIHMTRKMLETDYETKLQEKTFELYSRINNKLRELEDMHSVKVDIIRKAYRQQLADALARVETLFQARFEKQKEKERERHQAELQKFQDQVSNLTQTIQRNESIIVMLKQQLASKQKAEEGLRRSRSKIPVPTLSTDVQVDLGLSAHDEELLTSRLRQLEQILHNLTGDEPPPREDTTKIDAMSKELAAMKDQLKSKDRELAIMEDELDNKNAEINATVDRCSKLQNELEKEVVLKTQLAAELGDVKNQASKSSEEAKRLKEMAADLERQREELEVEAAERAKRAKEEAMGANSERIRSMQAEFAQKIGEMAKEKEELEKQLQKSKHSAVKVGGQPVGPQPLMDFSQQVQMNFMVSLNPENEPEETMFNLASRNPSPIMRNLGNNLKLGLKKHHSPHKLNVAGLHTRSPTASPIATYRSSRSGNQSPSSGHRNSISTAHRNLALGHLSPTFTRHHDLPPGHHSPSTDRKKLNITSPTPSLGKGKSRRKGSLNSGKAKLANTDLSLRVINIPGSSDSANNVSGEMFASVLQSSRALSLLSAEKGQTQNLAQKWSNRNLQSPQVNIIVPVEPNASNISYHTHYSPSMNEKAARLATPPAPTPPKKEAEEPLTDIAKLAKSEKELRIQCEKLRKEITRINLAWEKKFGILQSSLYALKDESYLRQHLEKQHTALHQATISYTAGPARNKSRGKHNVLPSIPNRAPSPDPLASYTVSRASNRQLLENQIDSDGEEGQAFEMTQVPHQTPQRFTSQSVV